MQKKVLTIKFKLRFAFCTCLTSMVVLATLAAFGINEVGVTGDARQWLLMTVVATASVGCVITVLSGLHLQRVICGGLTRMSEKFEEVATTLDLSKRSSSPRRDEFGRAAIAFDKLMCRVESTISAVHLSADSVSTATGEIAAGNLDLSVRTEQQAASLQETAASMMHLTETVRKNLDKAYEANNLATNATGIANTGAQLVEAMLSNISLMSSSSRKISTITGVIEGIAFQTNILALNAAVEAARAGEQGRCFAVVAGEVRSLALRCTTAAREINDLIGTSLETIRVGSQRAEEVSSSMNEIKAAITRVARVVGEIACASEEQSRGIEQVNMAVIQMDQVTLQNAALVEQAAAATQSLEEQAAKLRKAVLEFKLARDAATVAAADA